MHVSVTGVSHHETPVELRERLAVSTEELAPALRRVPAEFGGCAILSTCNRTEIYFAGETKVDRAQAIEALAAARGEPAPEGVTFYHETDAAAERHLFRVAAGVESLVIGESEILGQVREAFSAATAAGSGNAVLARLFHTALRVGRRARSETQIGAHGLSVAALAVSLSRERLGDLERKTVLVVGAGDMGRRAAGALVQHGVGRLLVTTRRSGLAEDIARELDGRAIPYARLAGALADADVVITCTAAPGPIVSAADVSVAMSKRPERPLVIVDIAVPRDVDAAAREIAGVHLYDIDDLQAAAEANLESRKREVGAVERIVGAEVSRYGTWLAGRRVEPTVAALRRRSEQTRRAELERTLAHLPHLNEADRKRLDAMSKALVKRILHAPMQRLREQGAEKHLDAVHDLFDLDNQT